MPKTDPPKTDIVDPTIIIQLECPIKRSYYRFSATNAVWVTFDHLNRSISKVIE